MGRQGSAPLLTRSLHRVGTLLITISAITPAASIFVMGQDVVHHAGTGALWCFLAAGLLALATAYVYAELSSAFPLTGGEYSMIGATLGPSWGFMALGLNIVGGGLGQAVTALGLADYLGVALPGAPAVPVALAATTLVTALSVLHVRVNAWITGAFLLVELATVAVFSALGALHPHRALGGVLLHPQMLDGSGALVPTPLAAMGLATAGAIYAFNGYGGACYFGEEMYEARKRMAWLVFWSLAVAAVAELTPIGTFVTGAADLKSVLSADSPFSAFILASGGPWIDKAVSLGVALAIINAMIAIALINARQLYASARDGVWPEGWNKALGAVHPRLGSPWISALAMGAITAACCFLNLDLLVMLTANGLVLTYAGVAAAVIAGRRHGGTNAAVYRMGPYPLAPLFSLIALAAVAAADMADAQTGRPSLLSNVAVMIVFAAYYALYLRRRGGWTLRGDDGAALALAGPAATPLEG
jgi:amino acid transporter